MWQTGPLVLPESCFPAESLLKSDCLPGTKFLSFSAPHRGAAVPLHLGNGDPGSNGARIAFGLKLTKIGVPFSHSPLHPSAGSKGL